MDPILKSLISKAAKGTGRLATNAAINTGRKARTAVFGKPGTWNPKSIARRAAHGVFGNIFDDPKGFYDKSGNKFSSYEDRERTEHLRSKVKQSQGGLRQQDVKSITDAVIYSTTQILTSVNHLATTMNDGFENMSEEFARGAERQSERLERIGALLGNLNLRPQQSGGGVKNETPSVIPAAATGGLLGLAGGLGGGLLANHFLNKNNKPEEQVKPEVKAETSKNQTEQGLRSEEQGRQPIQTQYIRAKDITFTADRLIFAVDKISGLKGFLGGGGGSGGSGNRPRLGPGGGGFSSSGVPLDMQGRPYTGPFREGGGFGRRGKDNNTDTQHNTDTPTRQPSVYGPAAPPGTSLGIEGKGTNPPLGISGGPSGVPGYPFVPGNGLGRTDDTTVPMPSEISGRYGPTGIPGVGFPGGTPSTTPSMSAIPGARTMLPGGGPLRSPGSSSIPGAAPDTQVGRGSFTKEPMYDPSQLYKFQPGPAGGRSAPQALGTGSLTPEGMAWMDMIAKREAEPAFDKGGNRAGYNVGVAGYKFDPNVPVNPPGSTYSYNGQTMDISGLPMHPKHANRGWSGYQGGAGTSYASGRYQETIWTYYENVKRSMQLHPDQNVGGWSQDAQNTRNWDKAQTVYKQNYRSLGIDGLTGDLQKDLEANKNNPEVLGRMSRTMSKEWTSAPGGTEGSKITGGNEANYAKNYQSYLERTQTEGAQSSGGTMLFVHGMQSHYGNMTPEQLEAEARRIAKVKGLKFESSPAGDDASAKEKWLRERLGKGGVSEVLGFSQGANAADRIKGDFPDTKFTTVGGGSDGTGGNSTLPGVNHMDQISKLADKAEADAKTQVQGQQTSQQIAQNKNPDYNPGSLFSKDVTKQPPTNSPFSHDIHPISKPVPGDTYAAGTERLKFQQGTLKGVDPKLLNVLQQATKDLPPGFHAEVISGRDDREKTHTHNHPNGIAMDVIIYDQNGKAIPHDRSDHPGVVYYEQLAQSVNLRGQALYPGEKWLWGGTWQGGGAPPKGDPMHYQLFTEGVGSQGMKYDFNKGSLASDRVANPYLMNDERRNTYQNTVRQNIENEKQPPVPMNVLKTKQVNPDDNSTPNFDNSGGDKPDIKGNVSVGPIGPASNDAVKSLTGDKSSNDVDNLKPDTTSAPPPSDPVSQPSDGQSSNESNSMATEPPASKGGESDKVNMPSTTHPDDSQHNNVEGLGRTPVPGSHSEDNKPGG